MKNFIKKLKGKKVLSVLLALVMVLTVASPAFSEMFGITAKAAEPSEFEVELGFNNLFLFEKWANNSLSSTVLADGVPKTDKDNDGLELDIVNGSFTLTKDVTACNELYTAFSMNETDATANEDYYMIDVEPNTTYTFSYNVTGNIWVFTPYVFFYDDSGLWIKDGMVAYATPGYENNSFEFTTPSNAESVQIRWTIGDNSSNRTDDKTSVYATVKDIAIYKAELKDDYLAKQNLFKLADWASNTNSSTTPVPDLGTVTPNVSDGSIRFVNSGTGYLWTGFGIDADASNDAYYTMDVKGNTDYTLYYELTDQNLLGSIYLQPHIVEMDETGKCLKWYRQERYTSQEETFTTQADTVRIQLVFALITDGNNTATSESPRYVTVNNIGIYETSVFNSISSTDFKTITGHEHRKYYPVNSTVYGKEGTTDTDYTLPVPSYVPEGQIFAGWYTGENGEGSYISADTAVHYSSLTVYPKFEPEIDELEVVTGPTKTSYTLGEKFNPAGLVLKATDNYEREIKNEEGEVIGTEPAVNTFNITSGYRWEPEYLGQTGTDMPVTVYYGGKSVTVRVNVSEYNEDSITVNGAAHPVQIANNKYTLDYSTTPFNRYELKYYSDSYVKGVITMDADTEEFFLEPSDNGHFASYIDSFLRGVSHYSVISIEFTYLNKDYGNFELLSVDTISTPALSDQLQFFENKEYKVGVDLGFGGVISYIEDLKETSKGKVTAAVYNENGKDITKVDYASKLPSGAKATSTSVNLINTNDRGRYLQQSYYGTDQPPFVKGDYNGVPWNYNPVQGGNLSIFDPETGDVIKGNESSKVIDYRITKDQIYVKTRPLDWGKNSVDYPDSFNTPSYMETWYSFEDGLIKASCRMVDFSGYPSNYTTQEFPALYAIEPLNNFVYNDVTKDEAFKDKKNWVDEEEPDFWGVLPSYNQYNPDGEVDVDVECNENWAAFTASPDDDSFGIGVYSAGITDIHYGCFPAKYEENQYKAAGEQDAKVDGGYVAALKAGTQGSYTHVENYRHTQSLNPSIESPTSYIAPIGKMTFESYKPITYDFYVTTATVDEIREDFKRESSEDTEAKLGETKIAVPETVYMTPANGASKIGKIYVNNILDSNDDYNVITLAESTDNMYFGLHVKDAKSFTVNVSNVTTPSNDIYLGNVDGSVNYDGTLIENVNGTYIIDNEWGLHFSGTGLQPGEKATAKWDITVTLADNSTETYTAYTVMYAPQRTVGAVAEGRQSKKGQNELSSWITGANGVDHSKESPLGSFSGDLSASGYFIDDPLCNEAPPAYSTVNTTNDLINVATVDNEKYVMQTAQNNTYGSSRSHSYLGLLTVDGSRYTNTNQIPNLEIGFDALRIGEYTKDSFHTYNSYYTLDQADVFLSTDISAVPSGWSEIDYIEGDAHNSNFAEHFSIPYRGTVTPSYAVSDIDGKYIHALNRAQCIQDYYAYISRRYSTAATSVLCSVTDKSGLRDAVLEGYTQTNTNSEFDKLLQDAATVLGDPSADQITIDEAKKELNNALEEKVETFYALKYDNLFSAYEMSQYSDSMSVVSNKGTATYQDGKITVVNDTITGGEAYTSYGPGDNYYKVALKPNTEYVFEFDVTTDVKAQAFMFFYASDGSGVAPTSMQVKINNGAWQTGGPGSAHWGVYPTEENAHYAVKFTTGANTVKGGFRFGNTSNDPVTSTFSNIKLVDSAHYYEDVEYTKTEDVYKEYASYGTLPTLSRTGYTLAGWSDAANPDPDTNGVTGATIATEHRTIYSQWDEHTYTINYNANGGSISGSTTSGEIRYSQTTTLPGTNALTKQGCVLAGWATSANATSVQYQPGQTVSQLTDVDNDTITLYAVWADANVKVLFDNLFDFSAWDIKPQNGEVSNETDTGFTITSTSGTDANTDWSDVIAVESGKTYIFSADASFTQSSGGYDMYVYTLDKNKNGETSATPDTANGAHREGEVYISLTGQTTNTKPYIKFTAGKDTAYVKIRFDANAAGNVLTVNNIRFYEEGTVADGVSYEKSITVGYGNKYGENLPTPTRTGYTFTGWKNAAGQDVTAGSDMQSLETVNLYSQWTENIYTVNYSKNGLDDATGTAESNKTYKYTDKLTLAAGYTHADAEFLGWSTNQYATEAEFSANKVIDISVIADKADANNNNTITFHAVWSLKDSVAKEDKVVVDFGLPITIAPFENDSAVLKGYHTGDPNMCSSYDVALKDSATDDSDCGEFTYNEANRTVTYTPTKVLQGVDKIDFEVTLNYTEGGTNTITSTITVTPASNIYYEETIMNVKQSTAVSSKAAWTDDGSNTTTTLGTPASDDVFGFENAYDVVNAEYSNGTARTVTVTSSQRNSQTQTFEFVGTGIDIVSRCNSATGIMLVNIKQEVDDGNGGTKMQTVKATIVDTYCAEGSFDQTPIFSWSGNYGKYTVEIGAMYLTTAGALNANNTSTASDTTKGIKKSGFIDTGLEMNVSDSFDTAVLQAMLDEAGVEDVSAEDVDLVWFDDNSIFNGGTGVAPTKKGTRTGTTVTDLVNYIDGFRVYNPLGRDASAYEAEGDNVSYANVIDNLAPVSKDDGNAITDLKGIAYLTGFGAEDSYSFEEYQQFGPKGELYLVGRSAISFKINRGENEKVLLALRAVNGATTLNVNGHVIDKGVNSATEMYYDITQCITDTGAIIITIENTGDNILAINHIKFSGGTTANGTVKVPRSMARSTEATEEITNKFLPVTQEDLVVIESVMNAEPIPTVVKNGVVIPIVEEEEEIPEDNTNTDNDNTNDDTNTDGGDADDIFDIFSLLKALLAFIKKILFNTVGNESLL